METSEDWTLHEDLDLGEFLDPARSRLIELAEEIAVSAVFSKLIASMPPVASNGRSLAWEVALAHSAVSTARAEAIDRLIEYVMPIFQQATLDELKTSFALITVDSKLVESMHSYLSTLSTNKEIHDVTNS